MQEQGCYALVLAAAAGGPHAAAQYILADSAFFAVGALKCCNLGSLLML